MTSQRVAKIGYAHSGMISLCDVYSRYQFKKRRDKILLKDVVLAKSNFEQSRSRHIHKALATHIWVATHGLRNTDVGGGSTKTACHVKLVISLWAHISSALHRCQRETKVEELVCFHCVNYV